MILSISVLLFCNKICCFFSYFCYNFHCTINDFNILCNSYSSSSNS